MAKQIEIKDLTIKLKDKVLFDNLNLTIQKGDRFVFLGPNGIGKSLLLELIFFGNSMELSSRYKGLQVSGSILNEHGENLLNPRTRRKISYVSQNEDFYKGMTVKEICESACNGIGIELNETRLDALLSAFGILDKKNQKIKNNVSFGEGKIIHIISRLLKLEASDFLLLDEPLNHLSFRNSKVFNDLVEQEIQQNPDLCVIMVSHCRAMSFADRAMVYTEANKGIQIKEYSSYDCFSHNDFTECFH